MSCSLLIPTTKTRIRTLEDPNTINYIKEVIKERAPGLSYARNRLAEKANCKILLFMDDDVRLDPRLWERIIDISPNEVLMSQGYRHPITRVMAIHKKTFLDIGGFDENIKYNGEDLDFYWRSLNAGYNVSIMPDCLVYHTPHNKPNWSRAHFESAYTRVKHKRVSLDFLIQTNPLIALLRFLGVVYYKLKAV